MHPTARRADLLVQSLGSDLLVYDQRSDAAHALNAAAALVHEHADGTRSVAELAALLARTLDVAEARPVVEAALADLRHAGLLEPDAAPDATPEATSPAPGVVDRRAALLRLGVAAAALPMVVSIVAPTPLMAQSGCPASGGACKPPFDVPEPKPGDPHGPDPRGPDRGGVPAATRQQRRRGLVKLLRKLWDRLT